MRKFFLLTVIVLIFANFTGCGSTSLDTSNRIVAPQNSLIPIQGKWLIEECINKSDDKAINKSDDWIGKTAKFSQDSITVGDAAFNNISYKVKQVNAEEYFLHKFSGPVEKLGIKDSNTQIVTVFSQDKFLYEFAKIGKDRFVANIDNDYFWLRKIDSDVDGSLTREALSRSETIIKRGAEERQSLRSGILLGIRTPVKTERNEQSDSINAYTYKTLWIAYDNGYVRPVLEAKNLFLPRKNGFWKLEVHEKAGKKSLEDILVAYSISKNVLVEKAEDVEENEFWVDKDGVIRKAIQYAGNDYVAIENAGSGGYKNNTKTWSHNKLQVLPVDSIANTEGIDITDIAGENGRMAMERAVNNLLETYGDPQLRDIDKESYKNNFGLYRKTGHWFFKGRLNFGQKAQIPFIDFNINLIPPTELIAYDILNLQWTHVKDRIPEAVDAFTSPNNDMAVIQTKDQILIYGISGEKLSEVPLKKVNLGKGESVVMAEWAVDYYVNRWESIFIKNNITKEAR
ncbi:MAG: hypothetical protein N3I35_19145 [Clostridia bacterium]|nr:hypothetical protein [Clostridia bacterium]